MARLEACYFDYHFHDGFTRFARVLEHSAAEFAPTWERRIERIARSPERGGTGVTGHIANTHKLDAWAARVRAATDGDELLLIDADTMILRPIDDVWAHAFDVAYTVRDHAWRYNMGVVFLRVSPRVRAFVDAWQRLNARVFQHTGDAADWRRRFGGVNQGAFGCLLETGVSPDLQWHALPCREWNCELSSWADFDPAVTRIVHVNGRLRRAVLGLEVHPDLATLVDLWRDRDRQARHVRRSA